MTKVLKKIRKSSQSEKRRTYSISQRVRASMAGADQFLVNPASRGDVARALDACGVDLPSDPRRG